MKFFIMLFACLFLVGCEYGAEQVKTFVTDPHYARSQEELDSLEHSYLQGKISYPDYVAKKKQLEDKYTQEVKEREDIIHDGQ